MLTIINAPNPILSQKTKPIILPSTKIVRLDKPIQKLIDEMKQTLAAAKDPEGVGLAAPQVGRSLQLFVIKPTRKSVFQTFINPLVRTANDKRGVTRLEGLPTLRLCSVQAALALAERRTESEFACLTGVAGKVGAGPRAEKEPKKLEGCLSLRNIWGEILRSDKVIVKYFDEEGRFHQRTFEGFPATIIQHEYDHLHGILFPKRVLEQGGKLYKSHKDKKGRDVFEEISL